MIDRRLIRPADGLLIRDCTNMQMLPKDGKEVVWSSYWERRLNDGDVVIVNEKQSSEAIAPVAKTSKKMGDKI
jgi:hypothetical protein